MARPLKLVAQEDPVPLVDAPLPLPDEPVPAFTYQMHDDYRRCSKCKGIYSCMSWRSRWMMFRYQGDMGRFIPPSFVENTPPCPHCERTAWSEQSRMIERTNAETVSRHEADTKKWQRREDARHGKLPGRRKPRKLKV